MVEVRWLEVAMGYPVPPGIHAFLINGDMDVQSPIHWMMWARWVTWAWLLKGFFPGTWWPISSAVCVSSLSIEHGVFMNLLVLYKCSSVFGVYVSLVTRGMGKERWGIYDFTKISKTWLIRSEQKALVLGPISNYNQRWLCPHHGFLRWANNPPG